MPGRFLTGRADLNTVAFLPQSWHGVPRQKQRRTRWHRVPSQLPVVAVADPVTLKNVPAPRIGAPDEIAWLLAFLCSSGASFVCGARLDVNGGSYMR